MDSYKLAFVYIVKAERVRKYVHQTYVWNTVLYYNPSQTQTAQKTKTRGVVTVITCRVIYNYVDVI